MAKGTTAKQSAPSQHDRQQKTRGGAPRLREVHDRQKNLAAENTPAELNQLIHERMRLAIVSALAVNESLSFNDLKAALQTTDGNLSVHARKLEEAQYIACTKRFEGRVPKTEYRLTSAGRRALEGYLDHMEALIRTMRER